MTNLSSNAIKAIGAFLDIVQAHASGEREGVTVSTVGLNSMISGPTRAPFNDYGALGEVASWCVEHELPIFPMTLTLDEEGVFPDRNACKLAYGGGALPGRDELRKAVADAVSEVASMDTDAVGRAREELQETVNSMNASKASTSRRALANARNQEIEPKSWDEWMGAYQHGVLDVLAPGEPPVRNRFLESQEGYKATAWEDWRGALGLPGWDEPTAGGGAIVDVLQATLNDSRASWITKRFGGFDLRAKLAERSDGIERFERAAFGFYCGDLVARDFFGEAVGLLGQQYSVVSHLMFLKDRDSYVPVKPVGFQAGLRKLGIEFYLSGFCSWDNYTKFLGYLERVRERLREVEPDATLLDAHSILWVIGSGYWLDGEGTETVERVRRGELAVDDVL